MYKSLFGEANGIEFTINKHAIERQKLESSYQLQIKNKVQKLKYNMKYNTVWTERGKNSMSKICRGQEGRECHANHVQAIQNQQN